MKKSVFFLSILIINEAFPQDPSFLPFGITSHSPISPASSNSPNPYNSHVSDDDRVSNSYSSTIPAAFSPCGSHVSDEDRANNNDEDVDALEEFQTGFTSFAQPASIIFSRTPLLSVNISTRFSTLGNPLMKPYHEFKDTSIISNFRLSSIEKIMLLHAVGDGFVYLYNNQPLCQNFKQQYMTWTEAKKASQFQGVKFLILTHATAGKDKKEIADFIRLHPQISPIFVIKNSKTWKILVKHSMGTTHVRYTEDTNNTTFHRSEIIYVNGTWDND
jgi:hypothetical protein